MKVLVVDDEAVSRRLIEATLAKWGYQVIPARDGADALARLDADDPPPLVILDWMMPGTSGIEVCRSVRRQAREPYTYIILLTSRDRREDIVEGLEAGADDYLTKPFDPAELKVRLRAGRRILELEAKLIEAREALRNQATHDALTGLYNRQAILDLLDQEFERARRQWSPLTLFMLDIDHFKRINDTHGHAAGDAVLRAVAERMRACIRPYDGLGRYGGEEFLVVLPGVGGCAALRRAECFRTCIAERPIALPGGGAITVTVSVGVASVEDPGAVDADAALREVDRALYAAKRKGRNRVESVPLPARPFSTDRRSPIPTTGG